MMLSKKPERDCDSMEVHLYNCGWNKAIDAITSTLPQRTWVGLTKDEIETLSYKAEGNTWTAVELAEAKLKEKNT